MERYTSLKKIGEGTYGTVYKCSLAEQETVEVAIKSFKESDLKDKQLHKTMLREITILQSLDHPNVISLLDVFGHNSKLCMVTEYVDSTVLKLLELYRHGLPELLTKRIMWQLLQVLHYLHNRNCIHRDIKPENLLISNSGVLKIIDFGFARMAKDDPNAARYTDYVATRWYRAPELLLGTGRYDFKVDIWAAGCLLYELTTGRPIFPGDSDMDQLWLILNCFGQLNTAKTSALNTHPVHSALQVPSSRRREPLSKRCGSMHPSILSFLEAAMHPDPQCRATAAELLQHEYFRDKHLWLNPPFLQAQERDAVERNQRRALFSEWRDQPEQSESNLQHTSPLAKDMPSIAIHARAGPPPTAPGLRTINNASRGAQHRDYAGLSRPITHHNGSSLPPPYPLGAPHRGTGLGAAQQQQQQLQAQRPTARNHQLFNTSGQLKNSMGSAGSLRVKLPPAQVANNQLESSQHQQRPSWSQPSSPKSHRIRGTLDSRGSGDSDGSDRFSGGGSKPVKASSRLSVGAVPPAAAARERNDVGGGKHQPAAGGTNNRSSPYLQQQNKQRKLDNSGSSKVTKPTSVPGTSRKHSPGSSGRVSSQLPPAPGSSHQQQRRPHVSSIGERSSTPRSRSHLANADHMAVSPSPFLPPGPAAPLSVQQQHGSGDAAMGLHSPTAEPLPGNPTGGDVAMYTTPSSGRTRSVSWADDANSGGGYSTMSGGGGGPEDVLVYDVTPMSVSPPHGDGGNWGSLEKDEHHKRTFLQRILHPKKSGGGSSSHSSGKKR